MTIQNSTTVATIIRDPDPDNGFEAGVHLFGFFASLRAGVFTPGTVVTYGGRPYRVKGALGTPQELVRLDRLSTAGVA